MIALYLFLFGCFLYYSRSKYFPAKFQRQKTAFPFWFLSIPLFLGFAVNIFNEGWVSGVLLSIVSCCLAAGLIQFTAVLGTRYFYGLAILGHSLVLLEFIS